MNFENTCCSEPQCVERIPTFTIANDYYNHPSVKYYTHHDIANDYYNHPSVRYYTRHGIANSGSVDINVNRINFYDYNDGIHCRTVLNVDRENFICTSESRLVLLLIPVVLLILGLILGLGLGLGVP